MAKEKTNPWGLTPREEQLMDMVILWGGSKAAARELDMAVKTAEAHMLRIRKRMGISDRSQFRHLLMWDRYRHEKGRPKAASVQAPKAQAAAGSAAGAGL